MRLVLLGFVAPSLALLPTSAAGQAAVPDPSKVVCKKEPRDGSRVLNRVCKTHGEWEAIAEQAKRSIGETRDQPQINPTNCGGSRPC
jgi:hypothetical protein